MLRRCRRRLVILVLLASVASVLWEREVIMAWAPPKLKSIEDVIQEARVHAFALPDETRQSFPIPVRGDKGLRVAFLYCPAKVVAFEGVSLMPPHYVTHVNAQTGKFEEMKEVSPGDFGQKHPPDQFMGKFQMPKGMTSEGYVAQQKRLYKLYDLLMPPFAADQKSGSEELKKSAKEFLELFQRLSEPPLQPYYQAAGKDFFSWLEKVAR